MDAALQLHRDVCLMTTNLDVLDQYVLCLQGTASKILKLGLGPRVSLRKRGGCGCHGTPGPPCVCTDEGHRTVVVLAGSSTHPLRTLLMLDIVLD